MKTAEEFLKDKWEVDYLHEIYNVSKDVIINLMEEYASQSQPQPVSVSEEIDSLITSLENSIRTANNQNDIMTATGLFRNKLFTILSTHQPTKIDEGFISVEDAMPPLAPADECVNELPFSQPVIVKNEIGKEMNGLYDFTERSWIDPVYENNIEYSEEIDGKAEYDHKITHWKAIAKLINGGNE